MGIGQWEQGNSWIWLSDRCCWSPRPSFHQVPQRSWIHSEPEGTFQFLTVGQFDSNLPRILPYGPIGKAASGMEKALNDLVQHLPKLYMVCFTYLKTKSILEPQHHRPHWLVLVSSYQWRFGVDRICHTWGVYERETGWKDSWGVLHVAVWAPHGYPNVQRRRGNDS